MIIFGQPYQVDHIELLGEYGQKTECILEQKRAVNTMNDVGRGRASFGCIKIGIKKALKNVSHGTIHRRER